ncbi:MAG: hypothetical protein KGZ79_16630 [Dethiobacter sp.]|jgi:hypothetical protein|nr:hypothetical protein [Dethiobacter sp.]
MKKVSVIIIIIVLLLTTGCSQKEPGKTVTILFSELMDQDYNVSKRVTELDGKKISITGFMAMQSPLDGSFIYLTNVPLVSCPYCAPGTNTPIYTIPAIAPAGKPITYTEQPVTIIGSLEVKDKTDQFGYTTPFRITVESLSIADDAQMSQSLKEYSMLASDGVMTDVFLILGQLTAYTCYDLSQLDPNIIYTIDIEEIDRLIKKVKGYVVPSFDPLVDILQKTKELSVEVNRLIENDKKEKMIIYSEEGLFIWYAYFAWADEMAALE